LFVVALVLLILFDAILGLAGRLMRSRKTSSARLLASAGFKGKV
jgi:hypothetical protein